MKICILIALMLFAFGPPQTDEIKLEIGLLLPAEYVPHENRNLYMTHSSQFRPFIERKVGGIKYIIAYKAETREIKYISTYDKRFKTSGGLMVGGYIDVQGDQVSAYPGWEIRGPEGEDGWQPLLGFDSEMTIRIRGRDATLKLRPRQFRLEAGQLVKAKIKAFVKGSN
jgi:hypothetical protein